MSAGKTPTEMPPPGPVPENKTVEALEDDSGILDCVAHITHVPVEQLRAIAKNLRRLPRTCRWPKAWALAAELLDHFGWNLGAVKAFSKTSRLPDLVIVHTAPQRLSGDRIDSPRFLVFVRRRTWPQGPSWEYLIDPRHSAPNRRSQRLDPSSVVLTDYLEVWRMETSIDF